MKSGKNCCEFSSKFQYLLGIILIIGSIILIFLLIKRKKSNFSTLAVSGLKAYNSDVQPYYNPENGEVRYYTPHVVIF